MFLSFGGRNIACQYHILNLREISGQDKLATVIQLKIIADYSLLWKFTPVKVIQSVPSHCKSLWKIGFSWCGNNKLGGGDKLTALGHCLSQGQTPERSSHCSLCRAHRECPQILQSTHSHTFPSWAPVSLPLSGVRGCLWCLQETCLPLQES